jgi:hypothetical protein
MTLPSDPRAGIGSPDPSIGADTFSVRWTGTLTAPASGGFAIYTRSDDRVRLTLDGTVRINNWIDHETEEDAFGITLVKDRAYTIQLEWTETAMHAVIGLLWSSPENGIPKQVIPTRVLTPAQ